VGLLSDARAAIAVTTISAIRPAHAIAGLLQPLESLLSSNVVATLLPRVPRSPVIIPGRR
jgi:hypothetical protein